MKTVSAVVFIVDVLETWNLHYDKFKRGRHASNTHPITEIWVKEFLKNPNIYLRGVVYLLKLKQILCTD